MMPSKTGPRVLLAEDDPDVRSYLEMALRGQGYAIDVADDGEEALDILANTPGIAAVLLDIVMPRRDGLDTLKEIRKIDAALPVIMVSGASSPLNVVEAMRHGANDFLGKPVNHSDLRKVLQSVLGTRTTLAADASHAGTGGSRNMFLGANLQMKELESLLPQIGWSEAPALILGETGAGKEVLARELHTRSPRAKKQFLKVNCAALPSELVESELFGYERGAFTGAFQKKPGLFELADQGTIFLDEIGDMDFKLQAKLLQVLQDQEFQRLGGRETVRVNVRVIAATHKDLDRAIIDGTFRSDLYYRLNVINLRIPPLRERKEDIPQLTAFLIQKHSQGTPPVAITPVLRDTLINYDWPGNIRELENIVRKLVVFRDPDMVVKELRARIARQRSYEQLHTTAVNSDSRTAGSKTILEQVHKAKNEAETAAIITALDTTHWNRKRAAMLLKLDYKALLYKMKKLGIDDRMAMLPASSRNSEAVAVAAGQTR
jgi:two-component system, NtrC family, response regulator AtoC